MNDFKSKLPNFQEITTFASKLFKDVKNSVCEIMDEYKKNREESTPVEPPQPSKNSRKTTNKKED